MSASETEYDTDYKEVQGGNWDEPVMHKVCVKARPLVMVGR